MNLLVEAPGSHASGERSKRVGKGSKGFFWLAMSELGLPQKRAQHVVLGLLQEDAEGDRIHHDPLLAQMFFPFLSSLMPSPCPPGSH